MSTPFDPRNRLGAITWLTSEAGGGPDVGMVLGLGEGQFLYVGEITREQREECAADRAELGDDCGWWLVLWPDHTPVARFASAEDATNFMDLMEKVTNVR